MLLLMARQLLRHVVTSILAGLLTASSLACLMPLWDQLTWKWLKPKLRKDRLVEAQLGGRFPVRLFEDRSSVWMDAHLVAQDNGNVPWSWPPLALKYHRDCQDV